MNHAWLLILLLAAAPAAADIFEAARDGDLNQIEADIKDASAIEPTSGLSAWQIAMMEGRKEAAELLAKAGADVEREFGDPAERLANILSKWEEPGAPGVAVLVAKDGQIVFAGGYGLANLETGEEISAETIFRIGSISKQFTATAILLLQEDGKLSIEDKLSKFEPDWPRGDEITLRMLLDHTSGIKSFTSLPDFTPHLPADPEEIIARFRDAEPDFGPGEGWLYNNSGYFLLGELASRIAGENYQQLLAERVYEPFGMTWTGPHRPGLDLPNEARGYVADDEGKWELPDKDWNMSQAGGAGEIYSTVGDLYRWNEALFGGKILKPETLAEAQKPGNAKGEGPFAELAENYALGWANGELRGLHEIWHNGGFPGFYCRGVRYTDQKLTIIALSNGAPPKLSPDNVARLAATLWLWREMDEQPCFRADPGSLTPEKLGEFVGTFDFKMLGVMRFRAADGKLEGKLADQPWCGLSSTGEDVWQNPSVKAKFTFDRGELGAVTGVKLEQGGLTITGERFEEPKAGELTREQLLELAGTFRLAGAGDFVIRVDENDRLVAKLVPQPEMRYLPIKDAKDRVFCRAIKVELQFERDDDGVVNAMVLHQGGAEMRGEKQ